jgi:iron complex outermembrane recepter protein
MKTKAMRAHVSGFALLVAMGAVGTAQAQETAAPAKDESVVVVTGIRASARSSVAIKKNTMEIVDSITAEDIGKLPDPNVSETLTRIPGVQGYRYGGEGASPVGQGSGITIRGLSGQTASRVNGRAFFTAGGREFNIEGAIPGMVAGIDVYKNPSAEHIEGGIGGLVDIRTRNPSDFKRPTVVAGVTAKYNDLAEEVDPELFVLGARKWDLEGGGRFGLMVAGVYQKATGRSDNNPGLGGPNYKLAIRADDTDPNYGFTARGGPAAYAGRSDVWYLYTLPTLAATAPGVTPVVGASTPNYCPVNNTCLTSAQRGNLISAPVATHNVFQETIMRTRKGLNVAADWKVNDTLRFYGELNYVYYQYHQNYRGLNPSESPVVTNLQTTPFVLDEAGVNRNVNGGTNDVYTTKRLLSANFLNTTFSSVGGDEHRPYETWVGAGGVEWKPTDRLELKADFSYIKADQTQDNRSVELTSVAGLGWEIARVLDGAPHTLNIVGGPDLENPNNWNFNSYQNNTHNVWDDSGYAIALSGAYKLDNSIVQKIKFGTRFAQQQSDFRAYGFNRLITSDGATSRTATNWINVGNTYLDLLDNAPRNFMKGEAGYSGGWLAFNPDELLGDNIRNRFTNLGIVAEDSLVEQVANRRFVEEKTFAGYVQADFSAFDDRLRGNVGVRVVKTEGMARAMVTNTAVTPSTIVPLERTTDYTNTLPSFNAAWYFSPDFLLRFGYGRGLTRAGLGDLNPNVSVNTTTGEGNRGNPDLGPQIADSYDVALERYFSPTNYVALAVFDKEIDGFFSGVRECETVSTAPAWAGVANGCSNGQYLISRNVNAQKGYARGVEVSGQYFFDALGGVWSDFGVMGSYTYIDTANPVNWGNIAFPRIVETQQPFVSKHNYTLSGMYDGGKLSARVVYTWRSEQILFGADANPFWGRYIQAYGILDAALNYQINDNFTLSLNASNLLDQGLNRFAGEPETIESGIERQHYANGRNFSVSLRYKFGG